MIVKNIKEINGAAQVRLIESLKKVTVSGGELPD